MTKIFTLLAAAFAAAAAMAAGPGSLKIIIPDGTDEIAVTQAVIADMFGQSRPAPDTIDVKGRTELELPLDPDEAMAFMVRKVARPVNGVMPAVSMRPSVIYAAPGDELTVDLREELQPVSGSALMDGITSWTAVSDSIISGFNALPDSLKESRQEALVADYNARAAALAASNADNALGVYMTGQILDQEAMAEAYAALTADAATSILAPMYERIGKNIERQRARAAAAEKVKEGMAAPEFALPDPEGKTVSLGDFKGKWVMLDFWGSWCGWCIKGIPQMKEEWAKMKDSNVVYLSIDCGDTRDKWLGALKQYELPWVNVWSDPDAAEQVSTLYAIEGFPTKFVIDPEGKIALKVVGEDPSFYDRFREAMK